MVAGQAWKTLGTDKVYTMPFVVVKGSYGSNRYISIPTKDVDNY